MNNYLPLLVAGGLFVVVMATEVTTNEPLSLQDMYSETLTKYANKDYFNAPLWEEVVAGGITEIECGTEETGARYCQPNNGFARFNYPLFDNEGKVGNKALIIKNDQQNDKPHMKVYFNSKGNLLPVKKVEKTLDDIISTVFDNIDNNKTFK